MAWLSVDDSDNDPQAVWSDVLGARTIGGALPAGGALRELVPAAGFGAREAQQVRAGLAELPQTVTLVLDDFQQIRDRRVLDSIGQLLENQPHRLRLVLVTRSDPVLRLNRLRVHGDLCDIRADDLAFTRDETVELLHSNGLYPSPAQLGVLLDRTQGWVAGLRLAMLCLDPADIDRGIDAFSGTDRLVADYLVEELLDRLPAADRGFLLTTSIADRINAALANELTDRTDGKVVLDRLLARNALLVGLAGSTEWFRFHPMLRDLLANRLALEQPGVLQDLHLRASRWFAAHGEPIHAIRHATAGQHWAEARRLLTDVAWPQALTPNAPALVAALGPAADRAMTDPSTGTLLAAAVRDLHRRDFDAMMRATTAAAEGLAEVPLGEQYSAEALIALLRVAHSRIHNPERTVPTADHLLGLLDRRPGQRLPSAQQHRVIATNNLAVGRLWTSEFDAAAVALTSVQIRCHELGLGLTELSAHAHLALLDVIHGRLPDAGRRAGAAYGIANRRGWAGESQVLGLFAALAMTDLEQGRLDMAAATIDSGLAISLTGSDACCRVMLGIAAVGVAVARIDAVAARAASARLTTIQNQVGNLPPLLFRWCAVAHAEAHLTAGEPEAATLLVGDSRDGLGFMSALERVAVAKARLLLGQPDAALDALAPIPLAALPFLGPLVEARVLAAVAADRAHRDTAALDAITEAIDLAQAVGMSRPFLAAGPSIGGLLTRHRHLVARHLTFTGTLFARDVLSPTAGPANAPVGPLTERERAVLKYLPTMLKSAEIASDLFVTINTVKTHQQAIYRKLGVNTRRDAVDTARALNLL